MSVAIFAGFIASILDFQKARSLRSLTFKWLLLPAKKELVRCLVFGVIAPIMLLTIMFTLSFFRALLNFVLARWRTRDTSWIESELA